MCFLTELVIEKVDSDFSPDKIKFNTAVSKCAGQLVFRLMDAYRCVRDVDLEGMLSSIGHSKCFDYMSYRTSCWRIWFKRDGDANDVVVPEAAEPHGHYTLGDEQEYVLEHADDLDQLQYYE